MAQALSTSTLEQVASLDLESLASMVFDELGALADSITRAVSVLQLTARAEILELTEAVGGLQTTQKVSV